LFGIEVSMRGRQSKYLIRTLLAIAHDCVACLVAWIAAFVLRFNFETPPSAIDLAAATAPWVAIVYLIVLRTFGLYRGIWRYASFADFRRIALAVSVGAIATSGLLYVIEMPVPRSVLVMHPILLAMAMCGSRLAYRGWKDLRFANQLPGERKPVLVLGGADAAERLIGELSRSPSWRVVGLLNSNIEHHGRQLHDIPVLGPIDSLPKWAAQYEVRHAIVAMPEATHGHRRHAVECCRAAGVQALTVPSFDDLVSGRVTLSQIRKVELDDLLGRDPVVLDTAGLNTWLAGHVVMVTGAGGSIGSELCRQIARYRPRSLILYEMNEYGLYRIEQEFRRTRPDLDLVCAIGDVRDATRVRDVLRAHRPSILFHAAAYKHVPLMESENAWQAVLNNVLGTHVVAEAAIEHGLEKFVFISTDKAVNPTSVMGASKRLAEMVGQALQRRGRTRFVLVRFGNVLGSTGSVIPKFRQQIAMGGPVTVTHPDMRRYFMSIPEAVQLVLQAGLMGHGGEIFVLDMGESVRIADLAREMIRLSGFTEEDIEIVYTGLRPGEKLYEEPLATDEAALPTPHPKLRIAQARREDERWLANVVRWLERPGPPDDETVKRELAGWVPEYQPELAAPAPAPRIAAR
jgi:FlaA1/EpsC-like NDP-sugar epimerase